eukprot:629806-Pyramimonas_sp.AAC.1
MRQHVEGAHPEVLLAYALHPAPAASQSAAHPKPRGSASDEVADHAAHEAHKGYHSAAHPRGKPTMVAMLSSNPSVEATVQSRSRPKNATTTSTQLRVAPGRAHEAHP